MEARRTMGNPLGRTAFGAALCVLVSSFGAAAQTNPHAPAPAPAPAAPAPTAPPPSDPAAPPAESPPAPAPAEPTAPAEPAPMAASPMLEEAPPPTPPPPPPEDQSEDSGGDRSAGPFSRGSIRLTALIGTGSTVSDTYLILGAGAGYFLVDGLELGLDYEAWILASPVFHRVSPETKYVFHMVPVIKPYVGVFYRHTFVTGGRDDYDQVG